MPLLHAIIRLEEVLDQENAALRMRRDAELADCNRRKSRALLELTRISRTLPPTGIEATAREAISRVREKLAENSELLKIHITAVREVSALLSRVIAETESDGTYSPQARKRAG